MFFIPENLILIIYTQPSPHLNKKTKNKYDKEKIDGKKIVKKQLKVFLSNPKLWSYASTVCSMSPAQVDCEENYIHGMSCADISTKQIKSGIMCVSLSQRFGWISVQILLRRKCEKRLTSSFKRLGLLWICMFMERFALAFCCNQIQLYNSYIGHLQTLARIF